MSRTIQKVTIYRSLTKSNHTYSMNVYDVSDSNGVDPIESYTSFGTVEEAVTVAMNQLFGIPKQIIIHV